VMALAPGADRERELTWLDLTGSKAISADGKTVVLLESGEGGGPGYSTYLRRTDGSPAVRLGDGDGQALSPDGAWVLAIRSRPAPELVLYPTGSGQSRTIALPGLVPQYAEWFPDGKRILLSAGEPGHSGRLYIESASGGTPRVIGAEGYTTFRTGSLSPDGSAAIVWGPNDRLYVYPIAGGEPRVLPGSEEGDNPCGWSADGTHVYVTGGEDTIPRRVDRVDVRTGQREPWKELGPRTGASRIMVTPDGRAYVYTYVRQQVDLYLAKGLK